MNLGGCGSSFHYLRDPGVLNRKDEMLFKVSRDNDTISNSDFRDQVGK